MASITAPRSDREHPLLPPVADDWHQHEFAPHADRPNSCIVCGRKRLWRHHVGPFFRKAA